MKGWFQDENAPKCESIREGPWELFLRPSVLSLTCCHRDDGSLLWKVKYKPFTDGLVIERYYWFDWEGDETLMLREQIYACQLLEDKL